MAISCGHCKSKHDSVHDVRVCGLDQAVLDGPYGDVPGGCGCSPGNGVYCNAHRRKYGMDLTRAYND